MSSRTSQSGMPTKVELDEYAIARMRDILITRFGFTFNDATLAAHGQLKLEESIEIQLARLSVEEAQQGLQELIARSHGGLRDEAVNLSKVFEDIFPKQNH